MLATITITIWLIVQCKGETAASCSPSCVTTRSRSNLLPWQACASRRTPTQPHRLIHSFDNPTTVQNKKNSGVQPAPVALHTTGRPRLKLTESTGARMYALPAHDLLRRSCACVTTTSIHCGSASMCAVTDRLLPLACIVPGTDIDSMYGRASGKLATNPSK